MNIEKLDATTTSVCGPRAFTVFKGLGANRQMASHRNKSEPGRTPSLREISEQGASDIPVSDAAGGAPVLHRLLQEEYQPGEHGLPLVEKEPNSQNAIRQKQTVPWRGRAIRSLAGVALLIVVGWIPVQRLFQVSSVEAVVNARLVTLRAPIGGLIEKDMILDGTDNSVQQNAPLVHIVNSRVDQSRLNDARRDLDQTLEQRASLTEQVEQLTKLRNDLQVQVAAFREGRMRQLQARVAEADALVASANVENDKAQVERARVEALQTKGFLSQSELDKAVRSARVAEEAVRGATAKRDSATVELDSLARGVFIGDSYNDQPRSAQRLDEIMQTIAVATADLRRQDLRHANSQIAVAREEALFAAASEVTIRAPVVGQIWEVLASPGEQVVAGQDLMRLLDCSNSVVTATVSEAVYNRLSVGTPARFIFREGGPEHQGKVVQLSGVASVAANLAILPSALTKQSYRVTVSVPDIAASGQCLVGRTGRVVFQHDQVAG